jgi:hypothetical protein
MKYTLELQKIMNAGNYLIALRDNFEELLVNSVLNIIQNKIEGEEIDSSLKNKIFGVVVECVQNICVSENKTALKKDSVLLLSKVHEGYKIQVGTIIKSEKEEHFLGMFELFKGLDTTQIMQHKNEIVSKNTELSPDDKEFLALADISSQSGGNINYSLETMNDERFLILEIIIKTN